MQTEPSFEHDSPRLSRRITLQWLAAAAAWSGIPAEALALPTVSAQGYGTDPVLVKPSTGPWRRILSRSQLVLLSRLADLILPPENGEPAPSRVGIAEFIDEWVSAPYPTQTADRSIVLAGLAAMERRAMQRYHQPVSALSATDLGALLDEMVAQPQPEFFLRLRYLVVGGYYTSDAGIQAIGFIGGVALPSYPGVTPEVQAVLEAELQKLGL